MGAWLVALGVFAIVVGAVVFSDAVSVDTGSLGKLLILGVGTAMVLAGVAMIRWGRALRTDPTPARGRVAAFGCIGAAIGATASFYLCFAITTGEGQLGCIFFPAFGVVVGSGVAALLARLIPTR